MMSAPKQIGSSKLKVDSLSKARGRHHFPSDIVPKDALSVRIARSTRGHAEIVSVDTSRASDIPGVVGVFTARDVPGSNRHGPIEQDQYHLCTDRVRYIGEPIAVVAAETDDIAREAAALVQVEYRDLPRVDFPLQDGTPPVHGQHIAYAMENGFGDVVGEKAKGAIKSTVNFSTTRQEHAFLEPEAGAAWYDDDGVLTLAVGGQGPHYDAQAIAAALDLPQDRLRVLHPMTGGAFGGKEDLNVQLPLALATVKTKRPSRLFYDRSESISVSPKRHAYQTSYEVTASESGQLLSAEIAFIGDAGPYLNYTPVVMSQSIEHCTGPYRFSAVTLNAKAVFTNNSMASAFRGIGAPQVLPGIEQAIDDVARGTGLSPFEVRRRNILRQGDKAGPGYSMAEEPPLAKLLDAAEAGALWQRRDQFKQGAPSCAARGVGVASVFYSYGLGSGAEGGARVRLTRRAPDNYLLELGTPDVGNGNTTSFLMIAAEFLECDIADIDYVIGDSFGPDSGLTHGSRTTLVVGNAVAQAAQDLKEKVDANPDDSEQVIEVKFVPEQADPFIFGMPHIAYNYLVQVMGLEVDLLTGVVSVLEVENHIDSGRAIHPQSIEGQIEGGFAQGLGFALYEDLVVEDGNIRNSTFANYVMPTIRDMPVEMRTHIHENFSGANPLGVRGLGEIGLPAVPASVANGIYDAIGHRFGKFPIAPEEVLATLQQEGNQE